MAEGADQEDRTQAATPRRLQRAREQGNVPMSREVPALAGLGAAALILIMFAPAATRQTAGQLSLFLSQAHRWPLADGGRSALIAAALIGAKLAAPFVLAATLVGCAAVLLQTGGLLNFSALNFNLARLSPRAGIGRLLSMDSGMETLKSLVKLAAMGGTAWVVLSAELPHLAVTPITELRLLPSQMGRIVLRLLLAMLGVQAIIAAADVVWVRLRHARRLRMSREEVREELKESEGDPHIKGRLKQIRRQRARKRMLAAVPKATVVVTNPTHYAVALAYDRTMSAAPRLVAKGVDSMAARIREVAAAHRVPIVANPPLARALYRVETESEIPAEHYQAVAELIAYVWRLDQRARGAVR